MNRFRDLSTLLSNCALNWNPDRPNLGTTPSPLVLPPCDWHHRSCRPMTHRSCRPMTHRSCRPMTHRPCCPMTIHRSRSRNLIQIHHPWCLMNHRPRRQRFRHPRRQHFRHPRRQLLCRSCRQLLRRPRRQRSIPRCPRLKSCSIHAFCGRMHDIIMYYIKIKYVLLTLFCKILGLLTTFLLFFFFFKLDFFFELELDFLETIFFVLLGVRTGVCFDRGTVPPRGPRSTASDDGLGPFFRTVPRSRRPKQLTSPAGPRASFLRRVHSPLLPPPATWRRNAVGPLGARRVLPRRGAFARLFLDRSQRRPG